MRICALQWQPTICAHSCAFLHLLLCSDAKNAIPMETRTKTRAELIVRGNLKSDSSTWREKLPTMIIEI